MISKLPPVTLCPSSIRRGARVRGLTGSIEILRAGTIGKPASRL